MKAQRVTLRDGRNITIRQYTQDDQQRLREFVSRIPHDLRRSRGQTLYTEELIENLAQTSKTDQIPLIAEHQTTIVGFSSVRKHHQPRHTGTGDIGIYLQHAFYSTEVGVVMTECLLTLAREHHLHKLNLYIVSENHVTQTFYEQFGFIVEGTLKDMYYGDEGDYHDIIIMGKILANQL